VKKLIFIFGLIAFSCTENKEPENSRSDFSVEQTRENSKDKMPEPKNDDPADKSQYTFKVIGTVGNYGYQIFDATGKMMINQPTIPAIQGNKGFQTEKDAQTAAEFVIQKIDKGIFPPTFSVAELDSLGLKY
jgi:hypothetical protein